MAKGLRAVAYGPRAMANGLRPYVVAFYTQRIRGPWSPIV